MRRNAFVILFLQLPEYTAESYFNSHPKISANAGKSFPEKVKAAAMEPQSYNKDNQLFSIFYHPPAKSYKKI